MDLIRQTPHLKNDQTVTVYMKTELQEGKPAEHRKLKMTLTNLIYNNEECKVATFRDVTESKKLAKI